MKKLSFIMILLLLSACSDSSESINSEVSNSVDNEISESFSSSESFSEKSESSSSESSIEDISCESETISEKSEIISEDSSSFSLDTSEEISSEYVSPWINGNDKVMEYIFEYPIATLKVWENQSFSRSMINKNKTMDKNTQKIFIELFKNCEMENLPIYEETTGQYTQIYQDTYNIKDECLYIEIVFYDFIECYIYVDHEGYIFAYGDEDDVWYRSINPLDKGEIKKYLIRVGNKTVALDKDSGENINHSLMESLKNNQVSNIIVTKDYHTYLYGYPNDLRLVSNQIELQILLSYINKLTVSEISIRNEETGEYSEEYLKYLESNPTDAYADIVFKNNDYGSFYANKEGYIYTFSKENSEVFYRSNEKIDIKFILSYLGIEKIEWNNWQRSLLILRRDF